jgi:hypothetical protein
MKVLTDQMRRRSLEAADRLASPPERAGIRREFTATEIRTAIERRDTETLIAFKASAEASFRTGSLDAILQSLDVLHGSAYSNKEAGRPLIVELDAAGFAHAQRLLTQIAAYRTHLHSPHGSNIAQARTELISLLQKQGVLKLQGFDAFAAPILEALEQSSPRHAAKLRSLLEPRSTGFDSQVPRSPGELEAKRAEQETARTVLDGDIGGKKPASKSGTLFWRAHLARTQAAG